MRSLSPQNHTQSGFTLVEVLIALSIFALISVMSYQAINTLTATERQSRVILQSLTELQRAVMIWERDLRQAAPRPIMDEYGVSHPALYQPEGALLELTSNNYYDWSGHSGHTLQRIRYSFRDGNLVREVWAYPDHAGMSQPQSLVLLSDLVNVSLEVIASDANQEKTSTKNIGILASSNAISLVIEHRQFGSVTRTLMLYP